MKIIFLDIDGVLNYNKSDLIDSDCLNNLRNIIQQTNAKIVLTSTWRVFLDDSVYQELKDTSSRSSESFVYHRKLLKDTFKDDLQISEIVPDLEGFRLREIQKYLEDNKDEIESFVIIDDIDFNYSLYFKDNWIETSWFEDGLNKKLSEKAIEILGMKCNK